MQLITALQAALRGLDYWRQPAGTAPPAIAVVEQAAPPAVWGALFLGTSVLVLLGLAGRWVPIIVIAHLLLGAVYVGLGVPVLASTAVGPAALIAVSLAAAVVGTWLLIHHGTRPMLRISAALPLMLGALLATSTALGTDYRLGTGLVLAGALQGVLALGVALVTFRRQAADQLAEEGVDRRD